MKVSYYPGCSLHSTAPEYDISVRKVFKVLGVDLVEIKDWVCCGSTPAHQVDELMAVALPVKNMMIAAETEGLKEFCVPCSECYSRMKIAQLEMEDDRVRNKVEKITGGQYKDDFNVMHALDMLVAKVGIDHVRQKIIKPLKGLKVVCYYGCLMTRPPRATGKESTCEFPQDMEDLLAAAGADPLDWNMRTFCCGASTALTQPELVHDLTNKILVDAEAVGAEVIAVGCPLCHANLDGRQAEINVKYGTDHRIPVLYFTELLGLALGMLGKELGLSQHLTDTASLLDRLNKD